MEYLFYPDIFWLTNVIMDCFVLILIRYFRKRKTSLGRMFLLSGTNGFFTVFFFIVLKSYFFYQLLMYFVFHPLLLYFTFQEKKKNVFWKDLFASYGIMMLLGGIVNWEFYIVGEEKSFLFLGMCGFVICILILHGFHATKLEELEYDILLQTEKECFCLRGFLDTGNLLMDPIMNQPVHIVERQVIEELLEKESFSFRYIPFHSLGQEESILPVITFQAMYLSRTKEQRKQPLYIEKPVLGLANEKLFQKRNYQIILNARSIL